MCQRRYRIYTEVCDLGNIKSVLEYYSRVWRRRRNKYKWNNWLERQREVEDAKANVDGILADNLEISVRDTKQEIVQACKAASLEEHARSEKERKWAKDPRTEFGDMSDIEDWFDQEVEKDLPEVIPEAFLWHVFDQLVDAALIMQRGGEPFKPLQSREKWREIVYKDLHPGNIFVKPPKEGFLGNDHQLDDRNPEKRSFAAFPKEIYPDVVLADFDTAIFDLQDDVDEYQDNPFH